MEARENRTATLAAEVKDLEVFAKEIKAKDGTAEEFPADFQACIEKSLTAKKELLEKAVAGDEAKRQELVKQLESMVVQKGIGVGRAKEIFQEFGQQSAPELKTKKMSVEQLEAVIEAVDDIVEENKEKLAEEKKEKILEDKPVEEEVAENEDDSKDKVE